MKYRVKAGFELKDIAGELILLPRGESTVDYNYVTVFNETGALIIRAMSDWTDVQTLAACLVKEYGISAGEAAEDTQAYLDKMLEEGFIEVQD